MKIILTIILVVVMQVGVSAQVPTYVTPLIWFEAKWVIPFPEQPYYFARGYEMQRGKQDDSAEVYEIKQVIYESDFLEPNNEGKVTRRLCKLFFYDYSEVAGGFQCWPSYEQNLPLVIYRERWR